MIVDSMTLREIHKELQDDIKEIGNTIQNRMSSSDMIHHFISRVWGVVPDLHYG